jgi:hypothetical protein
MIQRAQCSLLKEAAISTFPIQDVRPDVYLPPLEAAAAAAAALVPAALAAALAAEASPEAANM